MGKVTIFDHYSDQEHTLEAFVEGWGLRPWNDMNVPVGLALYEDNEGVRWADFLVFLPRKEHVKHVRVRLESLADLGAIRAGLVGVGEGLYGAAASRLERFAAGEMLDANDDQSEKWGASILYYWSPVDIPTETA